MPSILFFLWYLSSYIHYARIKASLSHIAESVPSLWRVDAEKIPRWMSRISRCFRAIGDTLPSSNDKPNYSEIFTKFSKNTVPWTRHNLSIRLYGHGVTGSLKKCVRSSYGETTSRQNERSLSKTPSAVRGYISIVPLIPSHPRCLRREGSRAAWHPCWQCSAVQTRRGSR